MTITFAWQFLPEFMFPMVASLAPLCWFAPNNHTVNFLGSGKGGVGLLNITLDWSNITSKVITYPYSVQIVVFASFVLTVSAKNGKHPETPSLLHDTPTLTMLPDLDPHSRGIFR